MERKPGRGCSTTLRSITRHADTRVWAGGRQLRCTLAETEGYLGMGQQAIAFYN